MPWASAWNSCIFTNICLLISYKAWHRAGGGCVGPSYNNQQNSFISPLSAYPCGRWALGRQSLRLLQNLFSSKMLICRPIVRTPIPVLILPDPLSVKKYKSGKCRRCCKRVVSANCQINKSEHMILHNIVRRAITRRDLLWRIITVNCMHKKIQAINGDARARSVWFQSTLSFLWKRKLSI